MLTRVLNKLSKTYPMSTNKLSLAFVRVIFYFHFLNYLFLFFHIKIATFIAAGQKLQYSFSAAECLEVFIVRWPNYLSTAKILSIL